MGVVPSIISSEDRPALACGRCERECVVVYLSGSAAERARLGDRLRIPDGEVLFHIRLAREGDAGTCDFCMAARSPLVAGRTGPTPNFCQPSERTRGNSLNSSQRQRCRLRWVGSRQPLSSTGPYPARSSTAVIGHAGTSPVTARRAALSNTGGRALRHRRSDEYAEGGEA
jgi:hypothetical protein